MLGFYSTPSNFCDFAIPYQEIKFSKVDIKDQKQNNIVDGSQNFIFAR
jgi:hypothetical protein